MNNKIKSGKEILEDFFKDIKKREDLNKNVVNILTELYENDEFTHIKIINALSQQREELLVED